MTAVINSPQAAEALARQRREEIRNAPHPSVYKDEWILLIKAELAYTNELERR